MHEEEVHWWKEDADRINALSNAAKSRGTIIVHEVDDPPELDDDGCMKDTPHDLGGEG